MKNIKFFIIAIVAVMMTSCYTTRTYTGNFVEQTDHGDTNVMAYSKTKQWYVIGSLVPLKMKHAPTPSTGNSEIVTKTKFVDALLGGCTLDLFAVRTIEVNAVASDGLTSLLKPKKEKYVIDNGLQYEIEAGGLIGAAGLISYKFAKRFSVGVGYWKGFLRSDDWDFSSYYGDEGTLRKTNKFYFNAQIRPRNKGFSPVLGANLGWQTVHMTPIEGFYRYADSEDYEDSDSYYYGDRHTQMVLTPYAGLSWRLGKNCYLSWRVGYNMAMGKVKLEDKEKAPEKCPEKIGVSSPYTDLNFTHTLPIGAGLHEKAIEKTRSVIDKVKKK